MPAVQNWRRMLSSMVTFKSEIVSTEQVFHCLERLGVRGRGASVKMP